MSLRTLVLAAGLLVGMVACSGDDERPSGSDSPFGGAGGGTSGFGGSGTSGAGGGAGTSAGGQAGTSGTGGLAGADAGDAMSEAGPEDAASDAAEDIEIVVDPCGVEERAVGSAGLVAGGTTSPALAEAFNEEVASMDYPGPLLMVFKGLNSVNPADWIVDVGGLTGGTGGGPVAFTGNTESVPFSLGSQHAVTMSHTTVDIVLHFDTPTTQADLPVQRVRISALFDSECETLLVEGMSLLLAEAAGPMEFHGSTIAQLAQTKGLAYPLEVTGNMTPVEQQ